MAEPARWQFLSLLPRSRTTPFSGADVVREIISEAIRGAAMSWTDLDPGPDFRKIEKGFVAWLEANMVLGELDKLKTSGVTNPLGQIILRHTLAAGQPQQANAIARLLNHQSAPALLENPHFQERTYRAVADGRIRSIAPGQADKPAAYGWEKDFYLAAYKKGWRISSQGLEALRNLAQNMKGSSAGKTELYAISMFPDAINDNATRHYLLQQPDNTRIFSMLTAAQGKAWADTARAAEASLKDEEIGRISFFAARARPNRQAKPRGSHKRCVRWTPGSCYGRIDRRGDKNNARQVWSQQTR